jgi:hypothetical protein
MIQPQQAQAIDVGGATASVIGLLGIRLPLFVVLFGEEEVD